MDFLLGGFHRKLSVSIKARWNDEVVEVTGAVIYDDGYMETDLDTLEGYDPERHYKLPTFDEVEDYLRLRFLEEED